MSDALSDGRRRVRSACATDDSLRRWQPLLRWFHVSERASFCANGDADRLRLDDDNDCLLLERCVRILSKPILSADWRLQFIDMPDARTDFLDDAVTDSRVVVCESERSWYRHRGCFIDADHVDFVCSMRAYVFRNVLCLLTTKQTCSYLRPAIELSGDCRFARYAWNWRYRWWRE